MTALDVVGDSLMEAEVRAPLKLLLRRDPTPTEQLPLPGEDVGQSELILPSLTEETDAVLGCHFPISFAFSAERLLT